MLSRSERMKTKELTTEQLFSVPCPTCGVPAGKPCVLNTGTPRNNPHIDRKFCAADLTKAKRNGRGARS